MIAEVKKRFDEMQKMIAKQKREALKIAAMYENVKFPEEFKARMAYNRLTLEIPSIDRLHEARQILKSLDKNYSDTLNITHSHADMWLLYYSSKYADIKLRVHEDDLKPFLKEGCKVASYESKTISCEV